MNQVDFFKKVEKELAKKFHLENLGSGNHVVRNERGWRDNEIRIEYILLITFDRAFYGKGGILNIKYEPTAFRENNNKEKLTKAIFTIEENGELGPFYQEDELNNFLNLIPYFKEIDLFEANRGITLDGIKYRIKLISANIETTIEVNNPNHKSWEKLESEIWQMGNYLANKSQDEQLKKLFEET